MYKPVKISEPFDLKPATYQLESLELHENDIPVGNYAQSNGTGRRNHSSHVDNIFNFGKNFKIFIFIHLVSFCLV